MAKYKAGDKIIVDCTEEELFDIGVISDRTFKWLLDSEPKVVKEVAGKQLYLENESSPDHLIWVYDSMVYRAGR